MASEQDERMNGERSVSQPDALPGDALPAEALPSRAPPDGRFGERGAQRHGALGRLSADEELEQAVCEALIREPELDSTKIGVQASNGVVTLTGSVRTPAEHRHAVRIARERAGAAGVVTEQLGIAGG